MVINSGQCCLHADNALRLIITPALLEKGKSRASNSPKVDIFPKIRGSDYGIPAEPDIALMDNPIPAF